MTPSEDDQSPLQRLDVSRPARLLWQSLGLCCPTLLCDSRGRILSTVFGAGLTLSETLRQQIQRCCQFPCCDDSTAATVTDAEDQTTIWCFPLGRTHVQPLGSLCLIVPFSLSLSARQRRILHETAAVVCDWATAEYDMQQHHDELARETVRQRDELNYLYCLSRSIQNLKPSQHVLQGLMNICVDHLRVDHAAIVLPRQTYRSFVSSTTTENGPENLLIDAVECDLFPVVHENRETIVINDDWKRRQYTHIADVPYKMIAAPLFCTNDVNGMLVVFNTLDRPDFSPEKLQLVEMTAYQISSIVNIFSVVKEAEKFCTVVEQTPDIVIITDRDGHIEYVNQAFENITGYTREEAIGRKPGILRSGRHGNDFYRQLWHAILEGKDFRYVFVNRKKSGELFHTQQTITPLIDETGKITHFVSTAKDITEQIHSEEQARLAMKEKLEMEAIGRAKTRFFSNMTHELRTPLNAILGYGELLMEDILANGDHQYARDLEVIIDSGHQLLALINNILDIARLETNRRDVSPETIDIPALIGNLETSFRPLAEKHGNTLTFHIAPHLKTITTDAAKLKQILLNLLSNAVRYTRNGRITLSVNEHGEDRSQVLFTVTDTGRGIDPAQQDRLFIDFSHAHRTDENRQSGGLGLFISQRYAEHLGGNITVESQPNVGSTFTLCLPRHPDPCPLSSNTPTPQPLAETGYPDQSP